MASNHLEDLVAEWYEFNGFFVRRNVQVGKRPLGGYECELDVIVLHPAENRLVHIEPSLDADTWAVREDRFSKKFAAGRKYIPEFFAGLQLPPQIEQIALLVFASKSSRTILGGGKIVLISEFMREIQDGLRGRSVARAAVPEQYPLLRSLQFAAQYWQ